MRETNDEGRAEIKQLRAALDQSESWTLKIKQSLSEREAELATLRLEMSGLAETRNGLELQLRDAGTVRTQAEQTATAQTQQVAGNKSSAVDDAGTLGLLQHQQSSAIIY